MIAAVNVVAWLGCAFLAVYWLLVSRKLLGFLLVLAGCVAILVVVRSDHRPEHLAGLLVCVTIITALIVAGYAMSVARKRRGRVVGYVPRERLRREPALEVKRLAARSAAPQARRSVAAIQNESRRRNKRAVPARNAQYVVNRGRTRSNQL